MKNFLITILTILLSASVLSAEQFHISKDTPIRFVRNDAINIPLYSWPRTLLSYPVIFDIEIRDDKDLDLFDNIKQCPANFQLSDKKYNTDGALISATINFFSELPYGGAYDYTLFCRPASAPAMSNGIKVIKNSDNWLIGNKDFGISVPVVTHVDNSAIPAPILSLTESGRTVGENRLHSPRLWVTDISTDIIEEGDLFAECGIHYTFNNGATYFAKVKVVEGYPFVILDETMQGISPTDSVSLDLKWTNFKPSRRYGNWDRQKEMSVDGGLPIDKPIYTNWCQEDPHWTGQGWIENPAEQMLYRLLPFAGNSSREQVPAISFWETGNNAQEIGIFVYDHNRWNDLQYGIWQPGTELCVYFRFANNTLHFKYPLCAGSRSTAITFYNVSDKQDLVDNFNRNIDEIAARGGADNSTEMGFRYAMMLHRQYGLLNLDMVKYWQLDYPMSGRHPESPFKTRAQKTSARNFYNSITTSPMAYYMTGLNCFPGIHSISHRPVFGTWTQDYLELRDSLSAQQLRTVNALMLLAGYVNSLESMNSIRNALAGTANMAADGWAVPGQLSFLFPDHPMAAEWADFFEKALEINGIFYTRPDVKAYESKGGRWVESLGIYNWAFLRPTSATNTALIEYDGKNRFADKAMAARGRWMLDMTTAPVTYTPKNGSEITERAYPPHGAHGGGRIVPRYCQVKQVADWMTNFDPILAEGLYWTGSMGPAVEAKPGHTDWRALHNSQYQNKNKGTNPHLRSQKYTGHGIVLRSGVDTDEELSIHLNQVDKGPNYRWGHQGQGNAGGLYFYAKGKIYTGHENEAVGDHMQNNLDGVTNFGVMKNGTFCNIGMNELEAPLYDLGTVQLAELLSAKGKDSTAWPEYISRSVMLVGTDYFILYDHTGTNWRAGARFSWFTNKDDDYPEIVFFGKKARPDHWSKSETLNSRGFYRDADGSLLTLVTHKKGEIKALNGKKQSPKLLSGSSVFEFIPDNSAYQSGIIRLRTPHSYDIIFRDGNGITFQNENENFNGEAGVIRRMDDGSLQLALMKGIRLSADGFSINLSQPGTAIAMTRTAHDNCKGRFKSNGKATLTINGLKGGQLFIDGVKCSSTASLQLPEGEHTIEYASTATPMPTEIMSTEYTPKGTVLHLNIPQGVSKAEIQVSYDNGLSWTTVGTATKSVYRLAPQKQEKVHVRAISANGHKKADFAQEYPVYTTNSAPHYPEGLRLKLDSAQVNLSWGEVLGSTAYRVYRRTSGQNDFKLIYEGNGRTYTDNNVPGVIPPHHLPGTADNQTLSHESFIVYEYTVTAVNGFGESSLAPLTDTHPARWTNWYPDTDLRFKRSSAFWLPPYVPASESPSKYYPD